MGIRIHKLLGYGLTDVLCDNYRITDPRFSLDEEYYEKKLEDFLAFLDEKEKNSSTKIDTFHYTLMKMSINEKRNDIWLSHSFIHDAEFGLHNVFLVLPLEEQHHWRRYDDIIDYLETPSTPQYKMLDRPIYPYDLWMLKSTGEVCRHGSPLMSTLRYVLEHDKQTDADTYAQAHGFNSAQHMQEEIVPFVPETVRVLCEWAQVFKDPKTVFELKPMIYTYWG